MKSRTLMIIMSDVFKIVNQILRKNRFGSEFLAFHRLTKRVSVICIVPPSAVIMKNISSHQSVLPSS